MAWLSGLFSLRGVETFGFIFVGLIIVVLLVFAEVIRNWVRICRRSTSREEVMFFQRKLEKIKSHFRLKDNSDVVKFCDQLDGIGFCGIAIIAFWIGLRNFL